MLRRGEIGVRINETLCQIEGRNPAYSKTDSWLRSKKHQNVVRQSSLSESEVDTIFICGSAWLPQRI
jgi:hypothetical protein